MSGRPVLGALAVIVLMTAVLPPAAAWTVNRHRVVRASRDVSALAARMRALGPQFRPLAADVDVLCGPGRMPVAISVETQPWVNAPHASVAAILDDDRVPADPWGNCYVVNPAATANDRRGGIWILSAGPNGILETPFSALSAGALGGDDVGVKIR